MLAFFAMFQFLSLTQGPIRKLLGLTDMLGPDQVTAVPFVYKKAGWGGGCEDSGWWEGKQKSKMFEKLKTASQTCNL